MEYQRHYVQITDGCEGCKFLASAFRLLSLPLTSLKPDELAKLPPEVDCLVTCSQLDEALYQRIYSELKAIKQVISLRLDHVEKPAEHVENCYSLKTPFGLNELLTILSHCLDEGHPDLSHIEFMTPYFGKLVGSSKKIRDAKEMIHKVANSNTTVLILGQSGSGKDVVASCIHQSSDRRDNPFVPINCGAIPSELMESELFGHEKGAFTGATSRRPGRFELANTGTLFLDEIGDMPMPMQVKLLRVIQDRKIDRVGGNHSIDVDVRLIAATNKNLSELIEEGKFREDLFYRLNVFPIQVPSLEERPEDIPAIIEYLLNNIEKRVRHRVAFTEAALELMCQYTWPGNIRELENFLERTVILHPEMVLNENEIDREYLSQHNRNKKTDRLVEPRRKRSSRLAAVK